jgi:hypothetical protein
VTKVIPVETAIPAIAIESDRRAIEIGRGTFGSHPNGIQCGMMFYCTNDLFAMNQIFKETQIAVDQ